MFVAASAALPMSLLSIFRPYGMYDAMYHTSAHLRSAAAIMRSERLIIYRDWCAAAHHCMRMNSSTRILGPPAKAQITVASIIAM